MSETFTSSAGFHDRRIHARRQTSSLAYVDLGEDNGGLVLNMSEGGIAVHAAVMLAGDHLPKIRFQLPQSQDWIESAGQVTWTGNSKKNAGIEFMGLPEEARTQIRNWLSSSEPAYEPPAVRRRSIDERRLAAIASLPTDATSGPDAPIARRTTVAGATPDAAKRNGTGASEIPSTPVASTAPIARNMSGEIESPIATPEGARPRRWAINPTFTENAPAEVSTVAPESRQNWAILVGAAVLLTAVSFTIGLATGRGAWTGIFASARNSTSSKSASALAEAPQSVADASLNGESGLPANSSGADKISNGASQNSAAISAAHGPRGPAAGAPPTQPLAGDAAAQTVIVHRAAPSQNANSASAKPDENSGSVLTMPDTPVSASDSVAVSSRLYIPVPAAVGMPGAQQRAGNVQIGRLVSRVEIAYPLETRELRVEGIVKLHVIIGADGAISSASAISGAAPLAAAALDAVRQWRYKPTTMDGRPIETEADVTIVFRLPQASQ